MILKTKFLLLAIATTTLASALLAAESPSASAIHSHMPEALRSEIKSVVVVAGDVPTNREITGTYEDVTPGFYGGVSDGSRVGTVSRQIGGVNVSFPIPILTFPGAVIGGITGKAKRELQEFRDAMAEDLARANSQPLTNDGLALDVYRNLQGLPELESKLFAPTVPVPEDTNAVLYTSINDITIAVDDDEAILTASAKLTLRRLSDEKNVYVRVIEYQDRDNLSNWTANDNALWHDFANFARHYLGREISAEAFDRIELRHELRPKATDTLKPVKKNDWQATSRSPSPTLAWELTLLGGNDYGAWADAITEADIDYDVEVYDNQRLVYSQKKVPDPVHTLGMPLEACKTYRWSVRPSYRIGDDVRYGEWMRSVSASDEKTGLSIMGRQASAAPAYTQDFAMLGIGCSRR